MPDCFRNSRVMSFCIADPYLRHGPRSRRSIITVGEKAPFQQTHVLNTNFSVLWSHTMGYILSGQYFDLNLTLTTINKYYTDSQVTAAEDLAVEYADVQKPTCRPTTQMSWTRCLFWNWRTHDAATTEKEDSRSTVGTWVSRPWSV